MISAIDLMLQNYELVKEFNFLGIKTSRWTPEEGTPGLPIEVTYINENSVKMIAIIVSGLLLLLFPEKISFSCVFPALLPFSGEDENGKQCGWKWLRLHGDDDVIGFGKFKKRTIYRNLFNPSSRKGFAIRYTLLFFISGLILSSIIVDVLGYRGLPGIA